MFIIYEGMDKTGKGTLKRAVAEATGFKYVHIDRGPIGYMVYDKLYDRESEKSIKQFERDWDCLKDNSIVVYLKADFDIIEKRISEHNDPFIDRNTLERTKLMYEDLIEKYCENVIVVDTTSASINECVDFIIKNIIKIFINKVAK